MGGISFRFPHSFAFRAFVPHAGGERERELQVKPRFSTCNVTMRPNRVSHIVSSRVQGLDLAPPPPDIPRGSINVLPPSCLSPTASRATLQLSESLPQIWSHFIWKNARTHLPRPVASFRKRKTNVFVLYKFHSINPTSVTYNNTPSPIAK